MKNIAVLFPGQGSQFMGMGKEFYDQDPVFHDEFDAWANLLKLDLKHLCFETNDLLDKTEYTQVLMTLVSSLIYRRIEMMLKKTRIHLAGHSLGEFGALHAAKVFDLETTLELVKYRGKIMAEAAISTPGKMVAIIGGDREKIESTCEMLFSRGHVVQVANYNIPTQTVISGEADAIQLFSHYQEEIGYKRLVYLNVSGAFHSVLMQPAARKFQEKLLAVERNEPIYPVIMNIDAQQLNLSGIDAALSQQLVSPVRFEEIVYNLLESGITIFVEIGPGNVLTNFIRKISQDVTAFAINTPGDREKLEEIL